MSADSSAGCVEQAEYERVAMDVPTVRRVVMSATGPGDAAAIELRDLPMLKPVPGLGQYYVWGWGGVPEVPVDGAVPAYQPRSHYPGPGEIRVTANVFANPSAETWARVDADHEMYQRLLSAESAGLVRGDAPKMHRTDTIDVGVVVQGHVVIEASDGSRSTLGPGDVYVQNGEMHAWHADPDAPALVVFVIVGARRDHEDQEAPDEASE